MRTGIEKRAGRTLVLLAAMAGGTFCLGQVQPAPPSAPFEQPDAERSRQEFSQLLQRYPPGVRTVLQLDHGLLENQPFLSAYPALAAFLQTHPEVRRNPAFYVGAPQEQERYRYTSTDVWRDAVQGLEFLLGFTVFAGLIGWFIRTLIDYKRWNRQNKVLTEVHSRLLERFSGNTELLAYIQSPAGSKFLESTPIRLDSTSRGAGAPMGRILWTLQAGVVVAAAGVGLFAVATQASTDVSGPVRGLGMLGIALGAGFIISAIVSFVISRRLGLLEIPEVRGTDRQTYVP
jgi:hypothetical protein